MYKFSPALIKKTRIKKKLTFRALELLTKEVDPSGKGITHATCRRFEQEEADPTHSKLCMICEALEISPRSCFVKIQ